jgi:hypothetical protein
VRVTLTTLPTTQTSKGNDERLAQINGTCLVLQHALLCFAEAHVENRAWMAGLDHTKLIVRASPPVCPTPSVLALCLPEVSRLFETSSLPPCVC